MKCTHPHTWHARRGECAFLHWNSSGLQVHVWEERPPMEGQKRCNSKCTETAFQYTSDQNGGFASLISRWGACLALTADWAADRRSGLDGAEGVDERAREAGVSQRQFPAGFRHGRCHCDGTLQNQIYETALSVPIVRGMWFLVFEFAGSALQTPAAESTCAVQSVCATNACVSLRMCVAFCPRMGDATLVPDVMWRGPGTRGRGSAERRAKRGRGAV
eukprot:3604656-Rhodomonas_salina.3